MTSSNECLMDKVWTLFFVFPLSLTIVNMSVVVQFYFHVSWKSGLVSCDLVSQLYGIHVIKCEILSRYISLLLSLPTFFIHFLPSFPYYCLVQRYRVIFSSCMSYNS